MRERVQAARERQLGRFGVDGAACNAHMGSGDLGRFAALSPDCGRLLEAACRRLGLSARGFDRIRRVSRTLADLEGEEVIQEHHVAEAVQYRSGTALPLP